MITQVANIRTRLEESKGKATTEDYLKYVATHLVALWSAHIIKAREHEANLELVKENGQGDWKGLKTNIDSFRADMKGFEKRLGNGISEAIAQKEDVTGPKEKAD